MSKKASDGGNVARDVSNLKDAVRESPGVYEVMRLYAQYQKVLEQSRPYLSARGTRAVGFSSSDRTG